MKNGTLGHIKTKRLQRLLQLPLYAAAGVLETLWQMTALCADDGAIGRYTNEDIAVYLEWEGDPDDLVAALVKAGFLDEHDEHRLVVHDWDDHAPNWIKDRDRQRKSRDRKRTVTGEPELSRDNPSASRDQPELSRDSHVTVTGGGVTVVDNLTKPNLTKPNLTKPNLTKPNPVAPDGAGGGGDSPSGGSAPRKKKSQPLGVADVPIPPELDTPEVRQAVGDWLGHHRTIGKPYRDAAAVGRLLAGYVRDGPAAFVEAVNHSIGCNYQGLVRPSTPGTPNGKPNGKSLSRASGDYDARRPPAGQRDDF